MAAGQGALSADALSSATIDLRAIDAITELLVIDADYRTLKRDVGKLHLDVPPGIYRIEFRAGPASESRLVALGAGDTFADDAIEIRMPTYTPLPSSQTYVAAEAEALAAACGRLSASGAPAGIGLMGAASALDGVRVLDRRGRERQLETVDADAGACALRIVSVERGGGYRLIMRSSMAEFVEQGVWVQQGWQTVICAGPSAPLSDAAIHMVRMERGWDGPVQPRLLLELLLWGLRVRRGIDDDLVVPVLDTEFTDPLLAAAAAHAFLDAGLTESVEPLIERGRALTPEHPDIRVSPWRLEEVRALMSLRAPELRGPLPRKWPPMFYAGYRALQRCDAATPGIIRPRLGVRADRRKGDRRWPVDALEEHRAPVRGRAGVTRAHDSPRQGAPRKTAGGW